MATHSSVLAWRISGMGEPDGLPSMGSQRVPHDWATELDSGLNVYLSRIKPIEISSQKLCLDHQVAL